MILTSQIHDPGIHTLNNTTDWTGLLHIDGNGEVISDLSIETTGEEAYPHSLKKIGSDYLYAASVKGEETVFGYKVASQFVKRDSSFQIIWRKPLGIADNHFNIIKEIIVENNHVISTGQFWDLQAGSTWAQIIKQDLDGNVNWEARDTGIWSPTGGSSNRMEGGIEIPGGSIFSVGYTRDPSTGHFYGLLLKITPDGCIDTLCTTAIDDVGDADSIQVIFYPNPFENQITILIPEVEYPDGMFSLYSLSGSLQFRQHLQDRQTTIDLHEVADGAYMAVFIYNANDVISRVVFKQKNYSTR